jgi:peptide/nickel transport system permease protein
MQPLTRVSPITAAPKTLAVSRRNNSLPMRLLRNLSGTVGLLLVLFYVVVALLGLAGFTPYPSNQQHPRDRLHAPNSSYIMGTDLFGRDIASRVMEGGANSLRVAVISVALSGLVGIRLGVISGFVGGTLVNLIMRAMDVFFAFPTLLLALVVVTVLGPGLNNAIIAIAIVYTPIFARVARGPVLGVKEMEYVIAARCLGIRSGGLLLRHILPNILAPLIVQSTLLLGTAVIETAALGFLGLGQQPPFPELGKMLAESQPALASGKWWVMLFPGITIVLIVLGFNLMGDALRDALDPRLRGTD